MNRLALWRLAVIQAQLDRCYLGTYNWYIHIILCSIRICIFYFGMSMW